MNVVNRKPPLIPRLFHGAYMEKIRGSLGIEETIIGILIVL
jgi:hypothetical protein